MPNREWQPGPWDTEPKEGSTWIDEASGLRVETWRHPTLGHWCGYVYTPTESLRHFRNEWGLDIPGAHGGITYEGNDIDGFTKVGFDCSHAGDQVPGYGRDLPKYETYRDLAYVRRCLRTMVATIGAAAQIEAALGGV